MNLCSASHEAASFILRCGAGFSIQSHGPAALCVYSVVMKSGESTLSFFIRSMCSIPLLLLKWQAALLGNSKRERVQSTQGVAGNWCSCSRGGCIILYLWGWKQPWLTTWENREVHLPQPAQKPEAVSHPGRCHKHTPTQTSAQAPQSRLSRNRHLVRAAL